MSAQAPTITRDELPAHLPRPGARWTAARKAALVDHLRRWPGDRGALTAIYDVTAADIARWTALHDAGGINALRTLRRPAISQAGDCDHGCAKQSNNQERDA